MSQTKSLLIESTSVIRYSSINNPKRHLIRVVEKFPFMVFFTIRRRLEVDGTPFDWTCNRDKYPSPYRLRDVYSFRFEVSTVVLGNLVLHVVQSF